MGLPSHQIRQKWPNSAAVYVRHRPETTLLYQIVQEYWPDFQAELASHGRQRCSAGGRNPASSASIEDPVVIQKILTHLEDNAISAATGLLPECRAPPSPSMGSFV